MSRYCKQSVVLVALAVAIVLCCAPVSLAKKPGGGGGGGGGGGSGPAYDIIAFEPPFASTNSSYISDINEIGTAALGYAELSDGTTQSAHFDIATQSYTPFPTGVFLSGINNLNQMVGATGDNLDMGAYWDDLSAEPVTLPPLDGDVRSLAVGINDDGVILGISGQRGVAWRVTKDAQNTLIVDGPVELPLLYAGAIDTYGNDINQSVVGTAQIAGISGDQAVMWTISLDSSGALVAPAAPLAVGTPGASWSQALAINNSGDVSGRYETPSVSAGGPFVALAGQDAQLLPLPQTRVIYLGRAYDINDQGEIVGELWVSVRGHSSSFPGSPVAYLWKDGEAIDLNSQIPARSGWELHSATAISNGGIIGGLGGFDGSSRGFLLVPNTSSGASVPEPSAVGLAVIGLIGLTTISRQRTPGGQEET